jgi:dynactin complex subunit
MYVYACVCVCVCVGGGGAQGLVKGKEGYFVGVDLDEPLGRNDGTYVAARPMADRQWWCASYAARCEEGGERAGRVDGQRYFTASGPRRGLFVRPTLVSVGDYPELDIDEL